MIDLHIVTTVQKLQHTFFIDNVRTARHVEPSRSEEVPAGVFDQSHLWRCAGPKLKA